MAEQNLTKRPRPFSLATGVAFVVIGVGSVLSTWLSIEASGVAALSLLLGGCAALFALATRRAPSPLVEQE